MYLEKIFTSDYEKLTMVFSAVFFTIGTLAICSTLITIINLKKQQKQNYPAELEKKKLGAYSVAAVPPGFPSNPCRFPSAPPFNQVGYNSQNISRPPPGMASYDVATQGFPLQDITLQGVQPPLSYRTN